MPTKVTDFEFHETVSNQYTHIFIYTLTHIYFSAFIVQLVASATRVNSADSTGQVLYTFSVGPQPLDERSFLGGFSGCDMGVAFHTDIFETVFMKTNEEGVYPTAAAMLRDLNLLYAF